MTAGWFERALAESHFLARYPMYAGVLARMDPIATDAIAIMAVALRRLSAPEGRIQLLVNVEYLEAHPDWFAGVLLHEIQHVVLGHLSSVKLHGVANGRAMEIAMELSANESIHEPMPEPIVRIEQFTALGIAPGQSTLQRYAILAEAMRCGLIRIPNNHTWDSHRPRSTRASTGPGLGDRLDQHAHRSTERNWNRKGGLGLRTMPEELARMRVEIARHLRGERGGDDDAARDPLRERVPKNLDRLVVEESGEREIDWARVLMRAFPRRREVRPDYLRVNRRFPDRIGEIPGRTRRPPRPSLLVGIDTSGSMNVDRLGRIAHEVRRLGQHARITIAECDAALQRVYTLGPRVGPFMGGGDTDFVPVFDEARTRGTRFEGLVYFTDGKGDLPSAAPSISTLWVLTNEDPFDCPWGTTMRLP